MKFAAISILFAALAACSNTQKPNPNVDTTGSQVALAEASYDVSRSISHLSETAQASRPQPDLAPPPNPGSYGMGALTSIDWSGPVEPITKQLAQAANYRFVVLGTEPAIPLIITINAKNAVLADVLRDVGYQCGRRANVVVYPESRVVELRYAKN